MNNSGVSVIFATSLAALCLTLTASAATLKDIEREVDKIQKLLPLLEEADAISKLNDVVAGSDSEVVIKFFCNSA